MHKMPLWIDKSYLSVSKREDSMNCRLSEIFYNLLYNLIYSCACMEFYEGVVCCCGCFDIFCCKNLFLCGGCENIQTSFAFLARLYISLQWFMIYDRA